MRPRERANCAFVLTTFMSLRHTRSTRPCTAAAGEPNSVALRNASFTMRCPKWNKHVLLDCCGDCPVHLEGTQRIQSVVVEELCFPATVRMAVALRQAQCSPPRSKQVAPPIARCSVLVFNTLACLRLHVQTTCHRMLSLASCSTNKFERHFGQS